MLRSIFVSVIIAFSGSALGANQIYTAKVLRTLVDGQAFGACMALVNPSPSAGGLDCKANWVTFSCSGDFNPKDVGYQKLSAAQLALMTGKSVVLQVLDTKKHNGYCYARRIDNLAN